MNLFKSGGPLSFFSGKTPISPFYFQLPESNENISSHEELANRTRLSNRFHTSLWRWKIAVALLSLVNTVTLLLLGVRTFMGPSDKQCTRQLSIYCTFL